MIRCDVSSLWSQADVYLDGIQVSLHIKYLYHS